MIQIKIEGPRIAIIGGDPNGGCPLHRMISKWPGWRRERTGDGNYSKFSAPVYPHTCEPVREMLAASRGEHLVSKDDLDAIHRVANSIARAQEILGDGELTLPGPPGRQLFEHQRQGALASKLMGYKCLIADDMGLGKTLTAITCFYHSDADRLLVVCPVSVKHNWHDEIRAALGEEVRVFIMDGTRKKKFAILEEALGHTDGVLIVNYDMLRHVPKCYHSAMHLWVDGQFVILDESHAIKSTGSKRTKFCMEHLRGAKYRICMSGTPVMNTIEDLYPQVEFIRPGFWSSQSDFNRRYLVQVRMTVGGRSFWETKGSKNQSELNALVNTFQIRRKKEDAFDLPPKIRTYPSLELDDPARRVYETLKSMSIIDLAELDDKTSVFHPKAHSAFDAALRCEQIAQGFIGGIPEAYRDRILPLIVDHAEIVPGRDHELIFPKSTKIKWTMEAIETILTQGGAPLVFSKFNGPIVWMHDQLENFGLITGDTPHKERSEIIKNFNSGELSGLLCQVEISEGWNAQRSQDVIFFGRSWSPARNRQAEDRAHRIGTKGTVNYQIPVMRGTIEQYISKRLEVKEDEAEKAIQPFKLTIGEVRSAL